MSRRQNGARKPVYRCVAWPYGFPILLTEPHLPLGHYRLTFKAGAYWRLPPFAGDMWRRALSSAAHDLDLRDDRLGGTGTVAGYLFESTPGPWAQKMRRYPNIPNPLILRPRAHGPRLVRPGEEVAVDAILVGHGNQFVEALLRSAHAAARKGLGLGESRGRAALSAVHRLDPNSGDARPLTPGTMMAGPLDAGSPSVPRAPTDVTIHLVTPLRVRRDGDYVGDPARLDARSLLMALVRRVSMLSYFHTESPLETDFAALKRLAWRTAIDVGKVAFEPLQRPETRQSPPQTMDGLVGKVRLRTPGGSPFWPYLWLARWIGIGHGANVGLGTVELETRPCTT